MLTLRTCTHTPSILNLQENRGEGEENKISREVEKVLLYHNPFLRALSLSPFPLSLYPIIQAHQFLYIFAPCLKLPYSIKLWYVTFPFTHITQDQSWSLVHTVDSTQRIAQTADNVFKSGCT